MSYEIILRVANPNLWSVKGKAAGFLVESLDNEGEPILEAAKGLIIYELPKMVLTPAILDGDGNKTTPAIFAQQRHINIDIWGEPALTTFATFYEDAVANNLIAQNNKTETAYRYKGLEVIDPETINSRTNRWFK